MLNGSICISTHLYFDFVRLPSAAEVGVSCRFCVKQMGKLCEVHDLEKDVALQIAAVSTKPSKKGST